MKIGNLNATVYIMHSVILLEFTDVNKCNKTDKERYHPCTKSYISLYLCQFVLLQHVYCCIVRLCKGIVFQQLVD